jgi:hypothetical protein
MTNATRPDNSKRMMEHAKLAKTTSSQIQTQWHARSQPVLIAKSSPNKETAKNAEMV